MTGPMTSPREIVERSADADLPPKMIGFAGERLMDPETGAEAGAGFGEKSAERVARRNGHRARDRRTRAGNAQGRAARLCTGSHLPSWLERRRSVLVAVSQEGYARGVSTRAMDDLVQVMGVSTRQVGRLCKDIEERIDAFLARPIEGEWPCPRIDAA